MFNRPRRPRDELREVLATSRGSFIFAGLFSLFINLLMLLPALYMLQLYDRVLSSRSESTLLALTLLVVALYAVLGLLEMVRSHLLVRISAKLDMSLNTRLFNAMFDAGLRQGRGNGAQPLQDLTSLRQFLTGNGLFAFFDAPCASAGARYLNWPGKFWWMKRRFMRQGLVACWRGSAGGLAQSGICPTARARRAPSSNACLLATAQRSK